MDSLLFNTAQSLLESYSPSLAGVAESLMGGYDGETSNIARSLADEARFLVYYYNTTTLVTNGALVIGIGFLALTAVFFWWYYIAQPDTARISSPFGRSGRQGEHVSVGGNELDGGLDFIGILDLLEGAFARYGVTTHECRRRIVCEAHHGTLSQANKMAAAAFTHALGYVSQDVITSVDPSYDLAELRNAADYGYNSPDCHIYAQLCPQLAIATLTDTLTNK